jgi:hypothetical protein
MHWIASFFLSADALGWGKVQRLGKYANSNLYNLAATLRAKTGLELAAGMEQHIFLLCLFPLCPLCECLPLAGIPSIPAPNLTLQQCHITLKMLIS